MSLFTGAAILGAALAGGAATTIAAHENAGAAKTAANDQATAAQNALAFTQSQKAKQEAAAAPYLSLGQMATANLPGAVRPQPAYGAPAPYTTQPNATRPAMSPAAMPLSAMGAATSGMPPPFPNGQTGQQGQPPVMGASPQMNAPMVTLQAPDGSTKQVPQSQAQFYVQRGAKVVG